jgi:outer membrane protein TolC
MSGRWARVTFAAFPLLTGCYQRVAPLSAHEPSQVATLSSGAANAGAGLTPSADEAPLTRAHARNLAHQSPRAALGRASARVAQAQIQVAEQLKNPALEASKLRPDGGNLGGPNPNLGIQIPIPRPGQIPAAVDAARIEAEMAQVSAAEAERLVGLEIDRLFLSAHFTAKRKTLLVGRLAAVQGQLALRESSVADGVITALDLQTLRTQIADLEDQLIGIDIEISATERELQALLGLPARRPLVPDGEWASGQSTTAPPEAASARLRLAELRRAHAHSGLFAARNSAWPWLRWIEVGYQFNQDPQAWPVVLGASVELPVLSWRGGDIAEASATVELAEAELRLAEQEAKRLALDLQEQARLLRLRADHYETTGVALAREALRLGKDQLAAGVAAERVIWQLEASLFAAEERSLVLQFEARNAELSAQASTR